MNTIPRPDDLYYRPLSYDLRNTTVNWYPMDNLHQFQKFMAERPEEAEVWRDQTIEYTFNSDGFRSPEFTDEPCIMFLGCSNTMGLALHVEQRWSTLVCKELGLREANLAVAGSSPDTAFRMTLGYLQQLNPRVIILRRPPDGRFESLRFDSSKNCRLADPKLIKNNLLMRDWVVSDQWIEMNWQRNIRAIQQLAQERSIPFLWDLGRPNFTGESLDWARDGCHRGPKNNRFYADYMINRLRSEGYMP